MNPSVASLSTRDRIIRSLFVEKDASGVAIESYITHVKIFEDVQYPASPPPQPTASGNLKERYVLLSVKNNGRVRMHKARGNDNGTFQIGKTWNLDDLQRVQDTDKRGMVVTLLKPYYWTMDGSKDKYNFVSALIKVYKKYTGGRMFELVGFDPQQFGSSVQSDKRPDTGLSPQRASALQQGLSPRSTNEYPGHGNVDHASDSMRNDSRDPRQASGITARQNVLQGQQDRAFNQPSSRVASSAYGGPTPGSPGRITSQTMNTPSMPPYPRNESEQFKAPIPRSATGQLVVDTATRSPAPTDTQPLRYSAGNMASSRSLDTFEEGRMPQKRQPDLGADVAPALSNFRNVLPPQSPISPPPPTKSARRPTQSNGTSSRALQDRVGTPSTPVSYSPVPDLPSKSGARAFDSPKSERAEVPWRSPTKERTDYFNGETSEGQTEPQLEPVDTQSHIRKASNSTADEPEVDFAEAAYFDEVLSNFKWTSTRGTKDLAYRLQDELAALEAANILAIVESDERVSDLMAKLDKGIAQCDDMSNLLTIYEFELASVGDHIKNIEGQAQGLQVQTANQKALVAEISHVLTNITISDADLEVLKGRGGSLESDHGIRAIEKSLVNLYRALRSMQDESGDGSAMSALKSKRKDYEQQSNAFLNRLSQFLQIKYQSVLTSKPEDPGNKEPSRVLGGHEEGFISLFAYSACMLYAQDIDPKIHADYMRRYAAIAKASWRDPIIAFATQWKSFARKATTEESEMLFTTAKDLQSTSAARTATIKRTNTIAKQLRGVGRSSTDMKSDDGKLPASEVFRIVLDNLALIIANEQNFLVSFFHLASSNAVDLPDYVASQPMLLISSLDEHRQTEPNRTLAKERYVLMETIFGWLYSELLNLVESLVKLDTMQVVGILKAVEIVSTEWSDSDQEFLLKTLSKVNDRLLTIFNKFMLDQVKAIKDIKVTSKKRGGIIPVFEIFPDFLERIEKQLQDDEGTQVLVSQLEIRTTVNEAYDMLSKAMFESVKTLASAGTINIQSSTDPEDKEVLNYHILMVENMHQYLEALNSRDNNPIFDDFKRRASSNYKEHLISYARQIVIRPIGRLQDFSDGLEKSRRAGDNPSTKSAYSQTSLKRLLSDYEDRDIKKGIAAMWKRVDKHFGSTSGSEEDLLGSVWRAVQSEYLHIAEHFLETVSANYSGIQPDFARSMIVAAFNKKDG